MIADDGLVVAIQINGVCMTSRTPKKTRRSREAGETRRTRRRERRWTMMVSVRQGGEVLGVRGY